MDIPEQTVRTDQKNQKELAMRFKTRQTSILLGLALAVAFLFPFPATADWLVTRGGDRIETDGPWEIKEKLVVFTLPGGGLSSLQLVDVDLDASKRLVGSEKEREGPITQVEAEEETRTPILVLTDADVSHVDPATGYTDEEVEESTAEARGQRAAAATTGGGGLAVADWSQSFDDGIDGVVVTGSLENRGAESQTDITMRVTLYSTSGVLAGRAAATLEATVLAAGRSTSFRATFPGIVGFDRPEFQVASAPLAAREEPEDEDDQTDAGPEDSEEG